MRIIVGGLVALALAAPAPALGASSFEHVWLRNATGLLCVDTADASAVSFTLRNPDGQVIESVAGDAPDTDSGACRENASADGAVGHQANFESGFAGGGVGTATQGAVQVPFALPFSADRVLDPVAGTQHQRVRALPPGTPFHIGALNLA